MAARSFNLSILITMNTEKENYQEDSSQDFGREADKRENYGGEKKYRRDNNAENNRNRDYRSDSRSYNQRPSYRDNRGGSYNSDSYNNRRTSYNRDNNSNGDRNSYDRGYRSNNSYRNNQDRSYNSYSRNTGGNSEYREDNRRYNSNPNWRDNNSGGYNRQSSRSSYASNEGKTKRPRISRYPNKDGQSNSGGYNNDQYNDNKYRNNRYNNNRYDNNRNSDYRNNRYSNSRGNNYNNRGGYDQNAKYSVKKQIEYKEAIKDPNEPLRLNKYLANAGVCSRREADEFITAGAVAVNDQIVTELGTKVKRSDEVRFNGDVVSIERKQYVLLNKPKDFVTTMDDPEERRTVMDLVKGACEERIYPVGRLDKKTTGVLLLTNDGELASKLTHPKYNKKKVYQVTTDRNVAKSDIDKVLEGVELSDGEIKADQAGYIDPRKHNLIGLEIHSGKNRIVRRIFEALGYKVVKLDRVFFAGLTKKGLRRGDWRYLTQKEVNFLKMGSFE